MLSEELRNNIETIARRYPVRRAVMVMALHAIQDQKGSLSREDIEELAEMLDLPPAEVESVATFYDMVRFHQPAKCRIAVCTSVSCMLRGSDELVKYIREKLGVDFGQITADGVFSLEEAECLGSCDRAPAISVNDEIMGPVTLSDIDALIDSYRGVRAG